MKFMEFMDSLLENSSCPRSIEILVKTDDDDKDHPLARGGIDYPVSVKTIVTPRAGGYADLHKAYMDLMREASQESGLFMVMSDDAIIGTKGWDEKLLNIAVRHKGWPHIINTVSDIDTATLSNGSCIGHVDTYPAWNREWISVAGFGYSFNTDGWTGLLCYNLERGFKINKAEYRTFCPLDIKRGPDEQGDDERWNGTRKWQIRRMESALFSDHMQNMAWMNSGALALAIRGNR
jgi:hypothetical protein